MIILHACIIWIPAESSGCGTESRYYLSKLWRSCCFFPRNNVRRLYRLM